MSIHASAIRAVVPRSRTESSGGQRSHRRGEGSYDNLAAIVLQYGGVVFCPSSAAFDPRGGLSA